jgi:hypothetical protein
VSTSPFSLEPISLVPSFQDLLLQPQGVRPETVKSPGRGCLPATPILSKYSKKAYKVISRKALETQTLDCQCLSTGSVRLLGRWEAAGFTPTQRGPGQKGHGHTELVKRGPRDRR